MKKEKKIFFFPLLFLLLARFVFTFNVCMNCSLPALAHAGQARCPSASVSSVFCLKKKKKNNKQNVKICFCRFHCLCIISRFHVMNDDSRRWWIQPQYLCPGIWRTLAYRIPLKRHCKNIFSLENQKNERKEKKKKYI